MKRWAGLVTMALWVGCDPAELEGPGGRCISLSECEEGLSCVAGRCSTDIGKLAGAVPTFAEPLMDASVDAALDAASDATQALDATAPRTDASATRPDATVSAPDATVTPPAGRPDASVPDASRPDAELPDAELPDAELPDA